MMAFPPPVSTVPAHLLAARFKAREQNNKRPLKTTKLSRFVILVSIN